MNVYDLKYNGTSLYLWYYQNSELQEYVKQYGIIIESWYPFGGRGHTEENFNNETIVKIAKKYNKTSAQIILRWQLQAGYIAIPGSKNPDHIKENISIFDYEYTDGTMTYHDTYFGGTDFIGEEVVYDENQTPIWAMNYHGVTLNENLSEEAVDSALRPALMKVGEDDIFH